MPEALDDYDLLDVYRARTDRLNELATFVAAFAPAVAARHDGESYASTLYDDDCDPDVLSARDLALGAAFHVIRKIAMES